MSGSARRGALRLCLDLNVFVADALSRRRRGPSAASYLFGVARDGTCPAGPVQLVISHGMLARLEFVLTRRHAVPPRAASGLAGTVAKAASLGPEADDPYMILGGTGVLPLRDAEDRGVLECALAGRADLLATENLRDFAGPPGSADVRVLAPGEALAWQRRGEPLLLVARPDVAAGWLRSGSLPTVVGDLGPGAALG